MPITPPVAHANIDSAAWGIPITNEVNRLTGVVTRLNVQATRTTPLPLAGAPAITFPTELADPAGIFDGTKITFTAATAGIWAISMRIELNAIAEMKRNVFAIVMGGANWATTIMGEVRGSVGAIFPVVAGSVVTFSSYSENTAAISIAGADLNAVRICT